MKRNLISLLAFLFASSANAASIIGDTVNISFYPETVPGLNTASAVVGLGQETDFYNNFGVDIGDNYVQVNMLNGPFCGFMCDGTSWILSVTGMDFSPLASILSVSLVDGGLQPYNATYTPDSVSFSMYDGAQNTGMYARLNFVTDAPSVPEPATIALMGLGFAGMGYARRRKSVQA